MSKGIYDTETLIKEYTPLVMSIASKYDTSPMEQEDIIQEGMIGLLAAIKSYDEKRGAGFKTYAFICIDNSIQTALRKFYRQKDVPMQKLVEYQDDDMPENAVSFSAEDAFLAKESVNLLIDELSKRLSNFENEVLKMFITGYSYSEIARKLGKDNKAVDNAVQRIRKKLTPLI